ncbi:hypothetical protein [Emticicia sp. 17c]|uniref:hypothetical protein n=1 Tax=Emticicia sp. 17c TaxID=3127704 RepID=UPI00301D3956
MEIELKKVIDGISQYYEWGHERFFVESYKDRSSCQDPINEQDLGIFPTIDLYELLKNYISFLKRFEDIEKLKRFIKEALKLITNEDYINNTHCTIIVDDIKINIYKNNKDTGLLIDDFINEIKSFIPYQN